LETELTSPEHVNIESTFLAKSKISFFPCKVQNFLKFFRKMTCSSNKFPDLTHGPSSYLPNISHRSFSFRIVIKNPGFVFASLETSKTLRSQNIPNRLPVDSQISLGRSKQARRDIFQPVPSLFADKARSRLGPGKDSRH